MRFRFFIGLCRHCVFVFIRGRIGSSAVASRLRISLFNRRHGHVGFIRSLCSNSRHQFAFRPGERHRDTHCCIGAASQFQIGAYGVFADSDISIGFNQKTTVFADLARSDDFAIGGNPNGCARCCRSGDKDLTGFDFDRINTQLRCGSHGWFIVVCRLIAVTRICGKIGDDCFFLI